MNTLWADHEKRPRTDEQEELDKSFKRGCEMLTDFFRKNALTAIEKDNPEDLTNDERVAICHFAGVPFQTDMATGKRVYVTHGLQKIDGKWIAFIKP